MLRKPSRRKSRRRSRKPSRRKSRRRSRKPSRRKSRRRSRKYKKSSRTPQTVTEKVLEGAPPNSNVILNSDVISRVAEFAGGGPIFGNSELLREAVGWWLTEPEECEAELGHISNWNVSKVTNMSSMFKDAIVFNGQLNNWDVSKVTDMSSMFYGAIAFNQPLNNWDISNVDDTYGMFDDARSFNSPRPIGM